MAVNTIANFTDAQGTGWNPSGSGTNWYAEKPLQCGGKALCVSSSSANLITAMQNNEIHQEAVGAHGAKHTSYPGHV
jgi:hypothetical protein